MLTIITGIWYPITRKLSAYHGEAKRSWKVVQKRNHLAGCHANVSGRCSRRRVVLEHALPSRSRRNCCGGPTKLHHGAEHLSGSTVRPAARPVARRVLIPGRGGGMRPMRLGKSPIQSLTGMRSPAHSSQYKRWTSTIWAARSGTSIGIRRLMRGAGRSARSRWSERRTRLPDIGHIESS